MANHTNQQNEDQQTGQVQFLLSDFNTKLRSIDERNKLIRERVLLLGKNLIETKEDTDEELREIKKENSQLKKELEELKRISKNITTQVEKFAHRDELLTIERMLKDFQPLEFVRKKDVEEIIEQKLGNTTNKKSK